MEFRSFFIISLYLAWEVHSTAAISRYNRNIGSPPISDWETGLREAAHQALLREHYHKEGLRENLQAAPIVGKHDTATPFGDIAVLAKGQLYSTPHGYQFIQDHYHHCGRHPCNERQHNSHDQLVALWSVKRIRHRDLDYGHRFELEYTISPIRASTQEVAHDGHYNYNLPGHVFIVKSDPRLVVGHQVNNHHQHHGSDKWYIPQSTKQYPVLEFGYPHVPLPADSESHFSPSPKEPNNFNNAPPIYTPPTAPNYYRGLQQSTNDPKEVRLYQSLIESLAVKTTPTNYGHQKSSPTEQTSYTQVPVLTTQKQTLATTPQIFMQLTTGRLVPVTMIPITNFPTQQTTSGTLIRFPTSQQHDQTPLRMTVVGVIPTYQSHAISSPPSSQYSNNFHPTLAVPYQRATHQPVKTTLHYFAPVDTDLFRDSVKEANQKKVTEQTKPNFTRKPTGRDPTDGYEDQDLFPDTRSTQPMKPVTHRTVVRPSVAYMKNQLPAPTYFTTVTGPLMYDTITHRPTTLRTSDEQETLESTQGVKVSSTSDGATAAVVNDKIKSSKSSPYTTSAPLKATTVFEYSFDSTTQPTVSTRTQSTGRYYTAISKLMKLSSPSTRGYTRNPTKAESTKTFATIRATDPYLTRPVQSTQQTNALIFDPGEDKKNTFPRLKTTTLYKTSTNQQLLPSTTPASNLYQSTPRTTVQEISTQEPTKISQEQTFTTLYYPTTDNEQFTTIYQPTTILAYPTTSVNANNLENTSPVIFTLKPNDITVQPNLAPTIRQISVQNDKVTRPYDYIVDDIFGKTRKVTTTPPVSTTPKEIIQSDLEVALFGNRNSETRQTETEQTRKQTASTPKIIFSNFYRPRSRTRSAKPLPLKLLLQNMTSSPVTEQTLIPVTKPSHGYGLIPLTQQSYSTSISFRVNKRNNVTETSTEPMMKIHFEPSIKAELQELHKDENYQIYKAELPATESIISSMMATGQRQDTGKEFDNLALQVLNHARGIDYLDSKNKTMNKITQPKYKRRNYVPKSRRGQKRFKTTS